MVKGADPDAVFHKRKAISVLLPYAIHLAEGGQQRMLDTFSCVARASNSGGFIWHCAEPLMATLFDKPSTPSLDRAIILVSPYLDWDKHHFNQDTVTRWSTAALAVLEAPYTEEIGRSVVDTLLQIVSVDSLRQHIPVSIWLWSNNQTSLPPEWLGGYTRTQEVIRQVRALGDVEILKSYLLLIWLEWKWFEDSALTEMCTSIREDFNGIRMEQHREELRKRLHHVLGQLDQGAGYLKKYRPGLDFLDAEAARDDYKELMRVLLEDNEAAKILTCTPSGFTILFDLLTLVDTYRISFDTHV